MYRLEILLFLHIVGVVIFFGNIITAAFWKVRADINGTPSFIHQTVKNVMLADIIFTLPGLVLIIVSGILMAIQAGYSLSGFNWLTISLILFVLTGIIWLALLLPLQRKMIHYSFQSIDTGVISKEYKKASRKWANFGIIATLLPIVILYFMISKGI
ncbi:DUF2269 family protein [Rossellomorea sp. BNER]|uniref:DUF2269 family protein n=1 Tax=Rossellomorea sp. BNER TaxID=2962031 RepID=UPI003AF31712